MLATRVEEWQQQWKREGLREGEQRGGQRGEQRGRRQGKADLLLLAECISILLLPSCDTFKMYPLVDPKSNRRVVCSTGLNEQITPEVERQFDNCVEECKSRGFVADNSQTRAIRPFNIDANKICPVDSK
jgi:hypothetical protein